MTTSLRYQSCSSSLVRATTTRLDANSTGVTRSRPVSTTKSSVGRRKAQILALESKPSRRRILTSIGTASLLALGANFGGITSFLLGFSPETARNLRLDVLYPVGGYSRYVQTNEGFEFIYPAAWVGDQTLLNRAVGKLERSLDTPLPNSALPNGRSPRNVNEPVVAFGPPGSSGELNVSVIVSPVSPDFSIEAFGGPKEVGEAVIRAITRSSRQPSIKGTVIKSSMSEGPMDNVKLYKLEFRVESPSFRRHNVAVCCAQGGRLFTLNAQAPESAWSEMEESFYQIADSFHLTVT